MLNDTKARVTEPSSAASTKTKITASAIARAIKLNGNAWLCNAIEYEAFSTRSKALWRQARELGLEQKVCEVWKKQANR
jgi:hypothetical protein